MKVLSVRQPWAWALIHGGKDVENRNWHTSFRGRLAIHAGKAFDMSASDWIDFRGGWYEEPFTGMAEAFGEIGSTNDIRGAIIGTVDVHDCVRDALCDSQWKAEGDEAYCWLVRNPKALRDPIPMKGQLGLWDVPDELFPEVRP